MIASMLLAVTTGASTPAPSPSVPPYPVIVHTITSRSCAVLHDTIVPIGLADKFDLDMAVWACFANARVAAERAAQQQELAA